ncbi:tetratricopeptide repeat protein [Paucibacter sp. M5-1]|uniref:tetratricopeptide repeat protein n=1 Tax=Paucibacter sp. M5-1 TaxID=3015998 RepID=UPI003F800F34
MSDPDKLDRLTASHGAPPPDTLRARLEALLARGRDDALLRFGLGKACLDEGDAAAAAVHLQKATEHKPDYTAAWKLLGKALLAQGRAQEAGSAWQQGLALAQRQGDHQAGREMGVFLKRLSAPPPG